MSVTEPDGLDDAVAQEWRTALLLAAQVAEWVARRAEQRARTQEQAALAEAGQTADRYAGERELARAEVAVADNPVWWDQADPAAVARVYAGSSDLSVVTGSRSWLAGCECRWRPGSMRSR